MTTNVTGLAQNTPYYYRFYATNTAGDEDMPPIVEKMYELNKWLLHKVGKFPRDLRLLLGERLIRKSLDIQGIFA